MVIVQFRSVSIQPAEILENYPLIFSALQPYLPVHKPAKGRRARRKKQTVAHLIDVLIEDIDRDFLSGEKCEAGI